MTADTLRRWREKLDEVRPLLHLKPSDIGSEDIGWINAATNADDMVTEEPRGKIAALTPAGARRFILSALGACPDSCWREVVEWKDSALSWPGRACRGCVRCADQRPFGLYFVDAA